MLVIIILIVVVVNFASLCLIYNMIDENNKMMEALKIENIRLMDILSELEKDIKKLGDNSDDNK